MRILITGGAGSLGVSLVERLLPQGHDICVIDNYATGHRGALPAEVSGLVQHEADITDRATVDRIFDAFQPTHVIHSAASYKNPSDWIGDANTNAIGTLNVISASKRLSVQRLINFQTALCYGRATAVPIPVGAPLTPFTSYGISKTAGELYVLNSGLPSVSFRLANVTGPRLSIGPIPTFYTRLKEGKSCFCSDTVRDFIDLDDFLDITEKALADNAPTGVFNVSTGTGHTIKEIYDAVAEHLGIMDTSSVPIVPPGDDDVKEVVLDPSLTVSAFQWKARIDFRHMMKRILRWYDEHGVDALYSHLAEPEIKKDRDRNTDD